MPLDSLNYDPQTRPALSPVDEDGRPDLSRPSLEGLAWLLRHPKEWPEGHQWLFSVTLRNLGTGDVSARALNNAECGTAGCALGVAARRWGPAWLLWDWELGAGRGDPGYAIFSNGIDDDRVTPSVVADRINDYLAGRPIRYFVAGDRS